ncbi:unnamed protein product [Spodoptera exigua]|nr:unnamed protein product [Spodoptera exigua]
MSIILVQCVVSGLVHVRDVGAKTSPSAATAGGIDVGRRGGAHTCGALFRRRANAGVSRPTAAADQYPRCAVARRSPSESQLYTRSRSRHTIKNSHTHFTE